MHLGDYKERLQDWILLTLNDERVKAYSMWFSRKCERNGSYTIVGVYSKYLYSAQCKTSMGDNLGIMRF